MKTHNGALLMRAPHLDMRFSPPVKEHCLGPGFSTLAPIIWNKIANAVYEAEGNGGGFLGKPYEPNGVIKNDIESILMERKPGGYRSPSPPSCAMPACPMR